MLTLHTEELADGATRAVMRGAMDAAGTDSINLRLDVIAASRARLVVDLREMQFLSSYGVRALIGMARTMSRRNGRMVLLAPSPAVRRVLETVGCDTLLPVVDDIETAQTALGLPTSSARTGAAPGS